MFSWIKFGHDVISGSHNISVLYGFLPNNPRYYPRVDIFSFGYNWIWFGVRVEVMVRVVASFGQCLV